IALGGLFATLVRIDILEEEPVAATRGAHEREAAANLHAEHLDLETPARELRIQGFGLRRPIPAAIPDDHLTGAVVAPRDHALEVRVLDGVVLDVDGESPFAVTHRRTLRHRPALRRAADLEPHVVMQAARRVLLNDEDPRPRRRRGVSLGARASKRLGRPGGITLLAVRVEPAGHAGQVRRRSRRLSDASRFTM